MSDTASIAVMVAETLAAQSETSAFDLAGLFADDISAQTETVKADIQGLGDSNTAPAEAQSFLVKFWLNDSAGTGVSTPTNANGTNDGANAVVSTAPAGATTETLTSDVGDSIPAGTSFTAAVYRGYFRLRTTFATSTAEVVLTSNGALFTDKVMATLAAVNGDTNHLTGTFTYDLIANGVDTLAKLQSCRVLHRTTDAAAGVSPAIVDVDAGTIEMTGVL